MNRKRILMLTCLALSMLLILGCGGSMDGCKSCMTCAACSTAPEPETVYDRIVELIEASKEVNVVLYGAGVPVYKIDSTFANYNHIYGTPDSDKSHVSYEQVTEYAKFYSESEIKELAEKVYTPACLAPFYTTAFDGHAFADSQNSMVISKPRYDFGSENFGQAVDAVNGLRGMRIFDYSSMQIIQPSTRELFRIQINTWLDSDPSQIRPMTLTFALQPDGLYYLDSFTS